MNAELKSLTAKFVGTERNLMELASFLSTMHLLGNHGATRTMRLWVDGDGAGKISVSFPEAATSEVSGDDFRRDAARKDFDETTLLWSIE